MKSGEAAIFEKRNIFSRLKNHLGREPEAWIIYFTALAFYLPGIWWGLPHATHSVVGVHSWDMDAVTGMQTLSELHNLFVEPKADWYLAYPPLHYVIIGIFYTPYFIFLYLTGGVSQPTGEYPFGLRDPVTTLKHLTLIGRSITVLMASGVIVNAYQTAQTVWDKRAARLTAIAVALPAPMVYYARTGNLDVPVLFWTSLAILLTARCVTLGFSVRRAVWLGVFAAMAVATKDQAYGALTVGLIMLIVTQLRRGAAKTTAIGETETAAPWKSSLALIAAGAIAFVLASGVLISPNRFFEHLRFIRNFEKTFYNVVQLNLLYPATAAGYAALLTDVCRDLFTAVGPVLLLVGVAGLVLTWRSTVFTKILAAMLFGHIVLVIVPVRHMQYRYILFPVYVFAFFAARALTLGLERREWQRRLTLAALIVGFGWTGLRAIDLTNQMLFDARCKAGKWLRQNGNPADKIAYFNPDAIPPLPNEMIAVKLLGETSPIEELQRENIRFVLIQPDFSSQIGSDRSHFFPDSAYQKITDGSLGYQNAASFETAPLFRGFFLDLPLVTPGHLVNPPVQIYESSARTRPPN